MDTIVWGQKSIKSICADDVLEKGWAATAIKESLLGLFWGKLNGKGVKVGALQGNIFQWNKAVLKMYVYMYKNRAESKNFR